MKKYIPNCLSILNLISGLIGTVLALDGQLVLAACAVFTGAIFDFLDGFLAKLLAAQSLIGKQLDSLADVITFGMVPGCMMYMLIQQYETCPYRPYAALFLVICSALRLAKFTVDDRQTHHFIGMPTPANAICVATLPMMIKRAAYPSFVHCLTQPLVLPLLTIALSYLLIAPIRFIAFKIKGISFSANKWQYFFIVLAMILVTFIKLEGVFFSICLYIFLSILHTFQKKEQ